MANVQKSWVWVAFAWNTLFATIFAILCWYTFSEFHRFSTDTKIVLPPGVDKNAWQRLFNGAAVSAFFALALVVLFVIFSIYYMVLSRKDLAHPRNRYGKGFMVGMSLYTAMFMTDIATHFFSFQPAMKIFVTQYQADFNGVLLSATAAFGYISAISFVVFALMLIWWRNKELDDLADAPLRTVTA